MPNYLQNALSFEEKAVYMSFGSIMYQLFLSPLTLIFEAVYSIAFQFLRSSGAAIIPLSLVVNLLLLPFYNRADAIQ